MKWLKRLAIAGCGGFLLFFGLNAFFPLKVNVNYSTQVMSRDSVLMHAFLSADEKWRLRTEVDEINPTIASTLMYKEDAWFYYHPGINPVSILRAAFNNIIQSKRTSGASTITMQVARMLYPSPRTYTNKVKEMFRALQLEWNFSKEEIMQMYLNLVPYGSNIEGIKSASYIYFQKPPQLLSLAEITALVIIPNKPTSLTKKGSVELTAQRNKWLLRMAHDKLYPQHDIADAIAEPIFLERHPLPRLIPHLAYRLKRQYPLTVTIYANIDRNVQYQAEKILKNYIAKTSLVNVTNGAVMVMNNSNGQVMAYCGSADFENKAVGGEVDGVQAIRSPGSALKPLIYGMAFDAGLLTPKTRIADVPMNVAGYIPENYDLRHHGNVSAEFALINSLNIPAVKTLNDVGLQNFIDRLGSCHFSSIYDKRKDLGLSIVLGGCGVTLEQLVRLYGAFANGGKLPTPALSNVPSSDTSKVQVVSEGSAYLLSQILSQLVRPDLPYNFQNVRNKNIVAWKTGTSYGRRDAWCIGYNEQYTVGVWVGNFDGTGVPELNGAEFATPLMLEIMNTITYNKHLKWFVQPAQVLTRMACNHSGLIPGELCTDTVLDYYMPMVSAAHACTHLHEVLVSKNEQYAYCYACAPIDGVGCKRIVCDNLSPELQSFYDHEHIAYKRAPPHNTLCERQFTAAPPLIVSPVNNMDYLLSGDEGEAMLLQAQVTADVQRIFWYINGSLYKSCNADERIFFHPVIGRSKVTCADDKGRFTNITFQVKHTE